MFEIEIFDNICVSLDDKVKALEFINRYKSGQFIYPNVIIRNLKLSKGSEIWILNSLIDNDLVEEMKYYRCPQCCSKTIAFPKDYKQEVYCEICDEEIDTDSITEPVYRFK